MDYLEEPRSSLGDGLLQNGNHLYTGDRSVNSKGEPALKRTTGKWKACSFIIGAFFCDHLSGNAISSNLVTYLKEKLHEGTVSAARNVTTFQGTCYLTPLIGAFLADAYWGRYWTIAAFCTIYFIGLCILTLSAAIPTLQPRECTDSMCPPATTAQNAVFFLGLYSVALGTGGIKPCIWPMGADQFDDTDPAERVMKGSFFNWNYFSSYMGSLVATTALVMIEENVGFGLGYGIAACFSGIEIITFLLGTAFYRFQKPGGSPLTRMCQVVVASLHKRKLEAPQDNSLLYETPEKDSSIEGSRKLQHSMGMICLDKAAVASDAETESGEPISPWRLCTVTQGNRSDCEEVHREGERLL
ncbi:hypothetical protein L6164_026558 [Bauhinia variegata]|uniref:Uncharacterized protein n=1 Tax=Bauhinia variegata TaxID=167791 RepID=A0ACB9LS25_BAUVA|nr:hypothetical protein L6164_026558 [Bauhinia variegata]